MKQPVTNKRDFVRRYQLGEFGNASPSWNTVSDFLVAHKGILWVPKLYSLRDRTPGGPCYYNRDYAAVIKARHSSRPFYVSEMAPHDIGVINGEVCRTERGLGLFYGNGKVPMRQALQEGKQVYGLQAEMVLKSKVDPSGYNWIKELLEEYPNHTIEFTSFSHPWGTLASVGHCTVIWEVRLY